MNVNLRIILQKKVEQTLGDVSAHTCMQTYKLCKKNQNCNPLSKIEIKSKADKF